MGIVWIIVYYVSYGVLNVVLARLHNFFRVRAIKAGLQNAIDHSFWFVWYAIACVPSMRISIWFFLAAGLQHAFVFPFAFNRFANPDVSPFYLSKTSKSGYDQELIKMKFKTSFIPSLVFFLLSVALLTKAIL